VSIVAESNVQLKLDFIFQEPNVIGAFLPDQVGFDPSNDSCHDVVRMGLLVSIRWYVVEH
jgi:hypothetical protein